VNIIKICIVVTPKLARKLDIFLVYFSKKCRTFLFVKIVI